MIKSIDEYRQGLLKNQKIHSCGFDVNEDDLNPQLFKFQKFCVIKALKAGKYALFEDCGLGKTIQQLEWAKHIYNHTHKAVLIIAPLAVVGQTIAEGNKFGYSIQKLEFYDTTDEMIYITNYDNIKNVNASLFSGVVLDESSILKNFDGKMKKMIMDMFKDTSYKLACTATPSPNDIMEIGNHSEFLNAMTRNEMLAMYFIHDGGNTSSWRLKGHCTQLFWDFVSQWAIMLSKPSDIGFDDSGYELPKLNIVEEHINTKKRDNGLLFNDCAVNATGYNNELRNTMDQRLSRVAEIVNKSSESFIIWIKQDIEGDFLRKRIPDAKEVRGSESQESKESKLLGFAKDNFRVLITKLKIAQFGLNYQNCHNQIFASLDFSFESTYQGIRRSWRFGQDTNVNIVLICTDTMSNVLGLIDHKNREFKKMQESMANASKRNMKSINKKKTVYTMAMDMPSFI